MGFPRREQKLIDGVVHFRCTGECGNWLPRESFRPLKNAESVAGVASPCMACERKADAAHKRNFRADPVRRAEHAARERDRRQRDAKWAEKLKTKWWLTRRQEKAKP